MPEATIKLSVLITLDIPEEYAARVTRDDLIQMAQSVIPDSMTHPCPKTGLGGPVSGVQLQCDEAGIEENDEPVFADVKHIEHDSFDADIEDADDAFTKLESWP
jgi:hypothetical protein